MLLKELKENVVKFETPEAKQKRLKKEEQVKKLKSVDNKEVQHKLDIKANQSKIKSVK